MNFAFFKKHALDLLLIVLMVLTMLIVDGPLPQAAEAFDYLATIGWTCIPFALCWLLLRVSSVFPAVATLLEGRASLVAATQAELETRSALNDALMWQARHVTKAQRKGV